MISFAVSMQCMWYQKQEEEELSFELNPKYEQMIERQSEAAITPITRTINSSALIEQFELCQVEIEGVGNFGTQNEPMDLIFLILLLL